MANVKNAVANILDTVIASSNTACTVINTVGKAANYTSNLMDAVLIKQSITLKVDNEIFKQTYVEQRSQELAGIRESIEQWCEENPRKKALYELSLSQLKAVL